MPKVGVGRVSARKSMPQYRVRFLLENEAYEFMTYSPNIFNLESNLEGLKEEAATLIRLFHQENSQIKEVAPKSIVMECDGNVILDCDDLTENSVNHAK